MIQFFRECSGDYLAIDTATNRFYLKAYGKDHFEGRATAIQGLATSVCITGVSRQFLREQCRRVAKRSVPSEWQQAIGL